MPGWKKHEMTRGPFLHGWMSRPETRALSVPAGGGLSAVPFVFPFTVVLFLVVVVEFVFAMAGLAQLLVNHNEIGALRPHRDYPLGRIAVVFGHEPKVHEVHDVVVGQHYCTPMLSRFL